MYVKKYIFIKNKKELSNAITWYAQMAVPLLHTHAAGEIEIKGTFQPERVTNRRNCSKLKMCLPA